MGKSRQIDKKTLGNYDKVLVVESPVNLDGSLFGNVVNLLSPQSTCNVIMRFSYEDFDYLLEISMYTPI